MRNVFYKGRFIFVPLAIAAFLSIVSFIVMQLWNNLLPVIFHVSAITFWQAMGLFILCKLLFGFGKPGRGFGGGRRAGWMRHRMEEKLKHMSPEERERFRKKMENRMCGYHDRWESCDWSQQTARSTESETE